MGLVGRLVLLSILFLRIQSMEVEFGFIVSGADEFGGHALNIYMDTILKVAGQVSFQFQMLAGDSGMSSIQYGMVWTYPKQKPAHGIAIDMVPLNTFIQELEVWLSQAPNGVMSTSAGFKNSVEFTKKTLFKNPDAIHVIVAFVHEEILGSEIGTFLKIKCPNALISAVLFPWLGSGEEGCKTKDMTSRLMNFNKRLNKFRLYSGSLAICGFNETDINMLPTILLKNFAATRQIIQVCEEHYLTTTVASITRRFFFFGRSSTTVAPTCDQFFCSGWSIAGVGIVAVMVLAALVLPVIQIRKTQKERHRLQVKREAAALRNAASNTEQTAIVAGAMAPTMEEIKERKRLEFLKNLQDAMAEFETMSRGSNGDTAALAIVKQPKTSKQREAPDGFDWKRKQSRVGNPSLLSQESDGSSNSIAASPKKLTPAVDRLLTGDIRDGRSRSVSNIGTPPDETRDKIV